MLTIIDITKITVYGGAYLDCDNIVVQFKTDNVESHFVINQPCGSGLDFVKKEYPTCDNLQYIDMDQLMED